MQSAIAGRVTIQIVEANPDLRTRQRAMLVAQLKRLPNVGAIDVVAEEAVRDLLAPWLGEDGLDADLPMPALVDATLVDASPAALDDLKRVIGQTVPTARIDRHADWLAPLSDLMATLKWLALVLIVLTAGATAAAVVLGSRAALDQHRATIDVMHLMGATDRQISLLFERRVSQDAVSGAALGFVVGIGILLVIGWRVRAVGAALVAQASLVWLDWALLLLIPVAGVGLAIISARITVLRSLAHIL
jgi:cell division transport system permease protein